MKNIDIDIDIDMVILENIDIEIDIDMDFLENIDIDKGILKNIDIDKYRIDWNLAYRTGLHSLLVPSQIKYHVCIVQNYVSLTVLCS